MFISPDRYPWPPWYDACKKIPLIPQLVLIPFKLVFIQSNHIEKWLIDWNIKPANSWCKHVFSNILVEQGPFKIFTSLSHLKNLWGFSFYLSHINSTYKNAKMPSFFSKTPWVCAPSQRPSHPQRWAGPPTWPRFLHCPLWRWRVGRCYWPWLGCFQKIGGFYPKRDQWKLMEKKPMKNGMIWGGWPSVMVDGQPS